MLDSVNEIYAKCCYGNNQSILSPYLVLMIEVGIDISAGQIMWHQQK